MQCVLYWFVTGSALAEVSEAALLRDVLFVFQNIDGRYVHFDSKQDAFRISDKVYLFFLLLLMFSSSFY